MNARTSPTLGSRTWLAVGLLAVSPFPALAQVPADLTRTTLPGTTGTLDNITALVSAHDGTNRLFVVQQPGTIRIYDLETETLVAGTFLDIVARVDDALNEQGLLGLAFHPDFETNRQFFVNYTYDPAGSGLDRTRVSRFTVPEGTPNDADENSEHILLEFDQDDWNHNGGDLRFGPDGYLYISVGDGGGSGDTNNRAQTIWYADTNLRDQALLGSLLRIDVDGAIEQGEEQCGLIGNYGIPDDNPFTGSTNSCDEIWAYGLRNPWRMSFDRWRGDLFIADVGQGTWEEIDFQPAGVGGRNYGWRCKEGTQPFNNSPPCSGTLVDPILEYSHSTSDGPNPGGIRCGNITSTCSITGGFRYTGPSMGELQDRYLFADYCTAEIFIGVEVGGTWSCVRWQDAGSNITTFGEDEQGELYLAFRDGPIQRFESPSSIFADGFEVGSVGAWSSVAP